LGDIQIVSPQTITWVDSPNPITVNIKVNTPPDVNISSPTTNTVNGTVTISGTAHDADSNNELEKVEIRVDSREWHTVRGLTSWSYEWNTETVSNGQHVIYAKAYDGTEYSSLQSMTFNVKNKKDDTNEEGIGGNGNNTIDDILDKMKYIFEDIMEKTKEKIKEMTGLDIDTSSLISVIAVIMSITAIVVAVRRRQ